MTFANVLATIAVISLVLIWLAILEVRASAAAIARELRTLNQTLERDLPAIRDYALCENDRHENEAQAREGK